MKTSATPDLDDDATDDSASVWSMLLATGSALALGYVLGRVTYERDVRKAFALATPRRLRITSPSTFASTRNARTSTPVRGRI